MGFGERRRCSRCRSTDHASYECMLDGPEVAHDGPVLRLAWADCWGEEWYSYVCRDHVPAFVSRQLSGDELVTLRRSDHSEWERACDLCVGGTLRRPLRLAERLEELRPRVGGPRRAISLALEVAVLVAVLRVTASLLPHLTRWQVVALSAVALALAPWTRRKLRGFVARLEWKIHAGVHAGGGSTLRVAARALAEDTAGAVKRFVQTSRRAASEAATLAHGLRAAASRYVRRFAAEGGDAEEAAPRARRAPGSRARSSPAPMQHRPRSTRPRREARPARTISLPEAATHDGVGGAIILDSPSYTRGAGDSTTTRCWGAPDSPGG